MTLLQRIESRWNETVRRPSDLSNRLVNIGPWFYFGIVTGVVILLFPVSSIDYKMDSIWYLQRSYRILDSFDYTHPYRGPILPGVTAIVLWLFGEIPTMAGIVPRIAFCVAAIGFAGLTRSLYGFIPGLAALLFFILSPAIHYAGTQYHVDLLVTAIALLSVWAYYEAMAKSSLRLSLASGVLLALTFLTKEIAILLIPLWALGWILFPPYTWQRTRISLLGLGVALLCLAPWAGYVIYLTGGNPAPILGRALADSDVVGAFQQGLPVEQGSFFGTVFDLTKYFIANYITPNAGPECHHCMGSLGWILLGAFGLTLLRFIVKRQHTDLLVLGLILLLAPLALFTAYGELGPRQATIFIAFLMLSVASSFRASMEFVQYILRSAINWHKYFHKLTHYDHISTGIVFIAFVTGISIFSAMNNNVRNAYQGPTRAYSITAKTNKWFAPEGSLDPLILEAGRWISEKLQSGEGVMTAYRRNAKLLEGVVPTDPTGVPVLKHNLKEWLYERRERSFDSGSRQQSLGAGKWADRPGQLLFLWPNADIDKDLKWNYMSCISKYNLDLVPSKSCKFYYVSERSLLGKIQEKNIKYIIVGNRHAFMRRYFDESSSFRQMNDFKSNDGSKSVTVFEVLDPKVAATFLPTVSFSIPLFINQMRMKSDELFQDWRTDILEDSMGAINEQIKEIIGGRVTCISISYTNSTLRPCRTE